MNYIQQAFKGNNEWYHWLFTIILVFIGWQIIGAIPLLFVALVYSESMTAFANAAADNFMSLGMDKNLFLFLMLFMFAVGLVFLLFSLKFIHKRSVTSLVTSRKKLIGSVFGLVF